MARGPPAHQPVGMGPKLRSTTRQQQNHCCWRRARHSSRIIAAGDERGTAHSPCSGGGGGRGRGTWSAPSAHEKLALPPVRLVTETSAAPTRWAVTGSRAKRTRRELPRPQCAGSRPGGRSPCERLAAACILSLWGSGPSQGRPARE